MSTHDSQYNPNKKRYELPPPFTTEQILDALREGKLEAKRNHSGQQVVQITFPFAVSKPHQSRQHTSGWKAAVVKYVKLAKAFFTIR